MYKINSIMLHEWNRIDRWRKRREKGKQWSMMWMTSCLDTLPVLEDCRIRKVACLGSKIDETCLFSIVLQEG